MATQFALLKPSLWLAAAFLFVVNSCRTGIGMSTSDRGSNESATSSITIGAPDPNQFRPELNAKLNGFHLTVNPVDPNCQNASKINTVGAFSNAIIAANLAQGCDYNLALDFGLLGSAGNVLDKVFFSNALGNTGGLLIRKEDIAGKSDVNLSITLKITVLGVSEGFGKSITTVVSPSSTPTPTSLATTTPTPSTIGSADFSTIQAGAQDSCQGCHSQALDESWWRTNAASITSRLQTTDPAKIMPKAGSSQAAAFTQDMKKKMLDFVK